jgi:uncharacterized protein (DUF924 family)
VTNATGQQDPIPQRAQDLYTFWFFPGYAQELARVLSQGRRLWWHTKDPEVDRRIAALFTDDLTRAGQGAYQDWLESSRGTLAFLILVDQFPRHIYRDDPRAFSFDSLALRTCRNGIARGFDQGLDPIQRYFFYLPFMHDETIEVQRESVALYEELYRSVPEVWKLGMGLVRDAARRHHEIIERFGRFPHRNAALSRHTTPAEEEFLKEPHSSF